MKIKKIIFSLASLTMLLGCEEYRPTNLGNGYIVDFNVRGAKLSILNSKNTVVVESQVLGYGFDSKYIVVSQRPWDSVSECKFLKGETPNQCKVAFDKSNFCQYWIIEKKTEKIFGPCNLEKYEDLHRQLAVKANIKLENR